MGDDMKPLNLKILNAEAIAKIKGGVRNGEPEDEEPEWRDGTR